MKSSVAKKNPFLLLLGVLICLIFLFLLSLPSFFSTHMGKNFLTKIILNRYSVAVDWEEIQLSWFSTQKIKELKAKVINRDITLESEEIQIDASLLQVVLSTALHKLFIDADLKIQNGKISLLHPSIAPILFENINSTVHFLKNQEVSGTLDAQTSQMGMRGSITIKGSAIGLSTLLPNISLETHIDQIPTEGINQILALFDPQYGKAFTLLGPSLTLASNLTISQGNVTLNLDANSANLIANMVANTKDAEIFLDLTGKLQSQFHQGDLHLTAQLQRNLTGQATLNFSQIPTEILDLIYNISTPWSYYLGDVFNLKANLVLNPDEKDIQFSFHTPFITIPSLHLKYQETLSLIEPSSLIYQVPLSLFNIEQPVTVVLQQLKIFKNDFKKSLVQLQFKTQNLSFTDPIPLLIDKLQGELFVNTFEDIKIKIDSIPLSATFEGAYLPSKVVGKLALEQFKTSLITLENLILPFQWDMRADWLKLALSATTPNVAEDSGKIDAEAMITNFSYKVPFTIKNLESATFECKNISTSWIESLTQKTGFSQLIGSKFNCHGKISSKSEKKILKIDWTSPQLILDSIFSIDPFCIQSEGTKNQIQWILTPQGYQAFDRLLNPTQKPLPFELVEKSTFSFLVDQLYLPWDFKSNLAAIKLQLSVKNPSFKFLDTGSKESIELTTLTASIDKTQIQKPLSVSFNTSVITKNLASQNPKTGTIALKGAFVVDSQNQLDFSKLSSDITLKVQQLPTSILDIIARTKGHTEFPFNTVFGQTVDSTLLLDIKDFNGPFHFTLNSLNTRVSVQGSFNKGTLRLDQTAHAQLKITPEISRLILKEINPLDLSFFYSESPITIQINPDQFSLPLYPFNKNGITISHCLIELGKITCRNEGNVKIALGILKSKDLTKNRDLELWFAPIDLHVQKGVIDVERTEILLANKFDIAVWGDIDLPKDYLNMQLGLTANTLNKAFGVKNLPEGYVLSLPMKGHLNNVKIDSSKATTKIGLLLAWQQADKAGALSKGPAGAIVGGLLNRMATLPDKDKKVPPAKRPFPWEIEKTKKETSHHEKMRHFKQNEKPLKQLLKVIR